MDWIYRLQQRLAITRRESIAILTLAGLFLLGLVVKEGRIVYDRPPDPSAYAEVEARFKARTAALPGANRPAATDSNQAGDAVAVRVNLNAASAPTLQQLPGIGPALSQRIVAHRQGHGAFERVEDITRVRGIGPKTLERLRPMLYVDSPPSEHH